MVVLSFATILAVDRCGTKATDILPLAAVLSDFHFHIDVVKMMMSICQIHYQ